MNILFALCLPREEASVAVVRRLCTNNLSYLGVADACVDDVGVALTEACTNVLQHAAGTEDQYEVGIEVVDRTCEIRVTDTGRGFDHQSLLEAKPTAEGGRGILLMKALVDNVSFVSEPEAGTIVHLVKSLSLKDDAVLRDLGAGRPGARTAVLTAERGGSGG